MNRYQRRLISHSSLVVLAFLLAGLRFFLPSIAHAAPNHRDYAYDMSGRLWRAMDAEGTLLSYTYDPVGNITEISRDKVDPDFNILGTLPLTGGAGDVVTIQGNGFDTSSEGNTVEIGGVTAVVVSVDPNGRKITVKVPWEAESGPITVTVGGKTVTALDDFTIVKYGDVGIRGTVMAGGTASHPLELVRGQSVQMRLADTSHNTFYPNLVLKDPSGVQAAVDYNADVAVIAYTATTTGTYDIVVSDRSGKSVNGDYVLYYAVAPGSNEGGALNPNAPIDGVIDLGDVDSFTFDAVAGQGVELRVADAEHGPFYPYIVLYDPNGNAVSSTYGADVAALSLAPSVTGKYTAIVSDASSGNASTGAYKIYFTSVPGSSDGGVLDPNAPLSATLDLGDLDAFTFEVSAGQGVELRVADVGHTSFVPYLRVFDPKGAVVKNDYNGEVAVASFRPSIAGTYTAVVFDYSNNHSSSGDYKIYYTKAPGSNDGGALDVNAPVSGTIDLGDLDAFTFDVTAGQGIELRVADQAHGSFVPYLRVFDPNGANVANDYAADVAAVSLSPSVSGTYTAVVFDYSSNYASTGDYKIYYTRAPGSNDGGALDPNAPVDGSIDLGDVDAFTFTVTAGQTIEIRVADQAQTAFVPYLRVFDPSGSVVSNDARADVSGASIKSAVSGTYTAVVFDYSSAHGSTGNYKIYYSHAPGSNDSGSLDPNVGVDGTLDLGDVDAYTFDVTAGQGIELRVTDLAQTSFAPYLRVVDPNGTVVANDYNANVAAASFSPSVSGKYTALVFDYSNNYASTGTYRIYMTRAPGSNNGGALNPNLPIDGTIALGELDAFTFDATAGQGVDLRVTDVAQTSFSPYLRVYDPSGKVVSNDYGADVAAGSFRASVSGKYTALVFDYSNGYGSTGTYKIYFSLSPGSNDGGLLSVVSPTDGTLDLGDLDAFTFDAVSGQSYQLRAVDTAHSSFAPYLRIYDPSGAVVSNDSAATVAVASFKASVTGKYTALLFDYSNGYASTGTYKVYFAQLPGSSDGVLSTAAPTAGTIELGDFDAYTFTVAAGAKVQLVGTDVNADAFTPYLAVYGPTGTNLVNASNATTATASFTASTAGTYTVLIYDTSNGYEATGDYTLALSVN